MVFVYLKLLVNYYIIIWFVVGIDFKKNSSQQSLLHVLFMKAAPPGKRYYYYSIFTPDRGKPDIKWLIGEGRLAECIRKNPPVLSAILTDMIRKKVKSSLRHYSTVIWKEGA